MTDKKQLSFTQLASTLKGGQEKQPEKKKPRKRKSNDVQAPSNTGDLTSEEVVAILRARAISAAEAQDAARDAEAKSKAARQELLEFMELYKVTKIPMEDRGAIRYKPAGEKKDVTKGGLETAVGDVGKAAEIWSKLPMKETKPSIEIPDKTVTEKSE